MKKITITLAIAVSTTFVACDDNSKGAMGTDNKSDTTVFERKSGEAGRPEETKNDTTEKNIGPAQHKDPVADSESREKH